MQSSAHSPPKEAVANRDELSYLFGAGEVILSDFRKIGLILHTKIIEKGSESNLWLSSWTSHATSKGEFDEMESFKVINKYE